MIRVMKHWKRSPGEVVDAPHMELSRSGWTEFWEAWSIGRCPSLLQGAWTRWPIQVLYNFNYSVVLLESDFKIIFYLLQVISHKLVAEAILNSKCLLLVERAWVCFLLFHLFFYWDGLDKEDLVLPLLQCLCLLNLVWLFLKMGSWVLHLGSVPCSTFGPWLLSVCFFKHICCPYCKLNV